MALMGLPIWAQVAPEVLYLAKLQRFYRERFDVLARQSCLMRVERYERAPARQAKRLVDRVFLDVTTIGSREYFAWPGSRRIDVDHPIDIVRHGLLVSGDLGVQVKGVLTGNTASIEHQHGRCYSFSIPENLSGFEIRGERAQVTTAYTGEFCGSDGAEPRLKMFRVVTAELPPQVGMKVVRTEWIFGDGSQGDLDALLPVSATTRVVLWPGGEMENRTVYSHCRALEVETVLRFDVAAEGSAAPVDASRKWLPDGLTIEVRLAGAGRTGETLEGVVEHDVMRKREVIVAKGAAAKARVVAEGEIVLEEIGGWLVHAQRGRDGRWKTAPFPLR